MMKTSSVSVLLFRTLPVTVTGTATESSVPTAGMKVITGGSRGGVTAQRIEFNSILSLINP